MNEVLAMVMPARKNLRRSCARTPAWSIVLTLCLLTGAACAKNAYRPIYYPDKSDLTVYTRGPVFDNLAQARQWVEDQHRQRGDSDWDYEVGVNCKPLDKDSDMEICKETLR